MKDEHVAEYVSTREFTATPGQLIVVFEFWRIDGELVRECVPVQDEYNVQRLRDYEEWQQVGYGELVGFSGAFGRFGNQRWWIEWVREAESPPFLYGWKWHTGRFIHRASVLMHLVRANQWALARRLLHDGYLVGKTELVFVRDA